LKAGRYSNDIDLACAQYTLWSFEDIVKRMDAMAAPATPRGPYKPRQPKTP
jgi:hypothetical protein